MKYRNGIFKILYFLSYMGYILFSIYLIRSDIFLNERVTELRGVLLISSAVLWGAYSLIWKDSSRFIWIVIIGLSPYLLTDAWLFYVDIVSVLVISAALKGFRYPEKYLILIAYVSFFAVILVIIFNFLGYIPSSVFIWRDSIKESYGFNNPNTIYFFLFSSSMVFFVLRNNIGVILCGVVMVAFFPSVQNRAFMAGYLIMLPAYFLLTLHDRRFVRWGLWVWFISVLSLGILSALLPAQVDSFLSSMFGIDVNDLLSNRLYLLEEAVYGRSFWETMFGGLENNSDSMFTYFYNSVGLIGFSIFLIFIFYYLSKSSKRYGSFMLLFSCIFFTVGLVESPFDGSSLIALLYIYLLFFDQRGLERWRSVELPEPNSRRPLFTRAIRAQ